MATIDEMNLKMTLYYSKSTGELKSFSTGIQDMSIFGVNETDFSQIWDYIVLDKDEYVMSNLEQFKINLTTLQLEMKAEYVSKYPVSTQ
jgi:hypothetical protein